MDIMDELQFESVFRKTKFIQIENNFINNPNYTTVEKLIYMSLCTYAFQKNNCYPSHSTLAENLGVNKRTIIRNLKTLEEKGGIIIISRKMESNRRLSNLYVLAEIDSNTGEFIKESIKEFYQYKNKTVVIKGK